MDTESPPGPRRRWWSWALVVHAVLVVVVVIAPFLMGPESEDAFGWVFAVELLLGTPWWLVTDLLYLVPLASSPVIDSVVFSLPLLINLGVHVLVLQLVRARKRRAAAGYSAGTPARHRRPAGSAFAVGALAGASSWGAWLGWDRTASYDVVTGTMQTPYVTLQVLGCALTVGIVTAILAARWHPVAAAGGVSVGFWLVWTVDAASQDDSGLFAVGAMMLAIGLPAATAVAAAIGVGVQWAIDNRRTVRVGRDS